jgi:hypothetical protein
MARPTTDIAKIISPLFKVWKYTALPIYKFENNIKTGETELVYQNVNTSYIGIAFFIISYVVAIRILFFDETSTIKFQVTLFELTFVFIQDIGIIISCHKKRNQIAWVVSIFLTTDRILTRLVKQKHDYTSEKRFILKVAIMIYCLPIITCVIDSINNSDERIIGITYWIVLVYRFHFELVVLSLLTVLTNMYQQLSTYVKTDIQYNNLRSVLEIHELLRNICKLLKNSISGLILVKTLSDTFTTTTGMYYSIRTNITLNDTFIISQFVAATMWTGLISFTDFFIAYQFHIISLQVLTITDKKMFAFSKSNIISGPVTARRNQQFIVEQKH